MDELADRRPRAQDPELPVPAFHVAEAFTGQKGIYVPVKETVRSFKEILEGKHDDLPEAAFRYVGTIEEAVERAKRL